MVVSGFSGAVGNTPLIELRRLSRELGRRVLGKAEFLNPGGSVKDRAASGIVDDAEARGALQSGGTIVEGTAGNTGIALALVANERGYKSVIVVPDDQSREKIDLLRVALPASLPDPDLIDCHRRARFIVRSFIPNQYCSRSHSGA